MATLELNKTETHSNQIKQNSNDLVKKKTNPTLKFTIFFHRLKTIFLNNLMIILIISSAGLGVGIGFVLRTHASLTNKQKVFFAFPGELFLRTLTFISLPLIVCNLITGISGLAHKAKRIALRAFIFYTVSKISAIAVAILIAITVRPGYQVNISKGNLEKFENGFKQTGFNDPVDTSYTILDIIRNLVPNNIVKMMFSSYRSKLIPIYSNQSFNLSINGSDSIVNSTVIKDYSATPGSTEQTNLMGILTFCIVFGRIIGVLGDRGRDLHNFFETLSKSFLEMIQIIIWMSPFGVFSLLCGTIISLDNLDGLFRSFSFYIASCLIGLSIQGVVILPLIYFIITRKSLFSMLKNSGEALLVALATASSLATLPVTLKCVEQKIQIPKLISRPILFIGTSIHFSGTSVSRLIGIFYIVQTINKTLTLGDYFLAAFLSFISTTAMAPIPSGGLIGSVLILNGLNVDQGLIGLIFPIDWLIGRLAAAVNVWGNCLATASVSHLSRYEIEESKV